MNSVVQSKRIVSSILVTAVLLYFMATTPSPRIIFVSFLICSLSMTVREVSLLLGKEKTAFVFHMMFAAGFLLFWLGFLVAAAYYALEKNSYGLLALSIPFWIIGVRVLRNILQRGKLKEKTGENARPKIGFPVVASAIPVGAALMAGVVILCLGIGNGSTGLVFAGAFLVFGAFTFVLLALILQGRFDNVIVDVLGIYMGAMIVAVGLGFVALKYGKTLSLVQTVEEIGLWIVVPILMIAGGVTQIVKSLNRKA